MEVPSLFDQCLKKCVFSDIKVEEYLKNYSLPIFAEVKTLYLSQRFCWGQLYNIPSIGILYDIPHAFTTDEKCLCIERNNKVKYYGQYSCTPLYTNFDIPEKNEDYSKIIYNGQTDVQRKN
ncbi:nonstructural protein NS-3 [Culex pipiens densovirus]|uniref:Nonstructural protein NS-3 n=1 Tax=Culex pipiens densovirus TaxID=185638 RepID=C4P0S0_9VIRU|nr:nonstructural protein NS-3 [Culex pipiens densovirus]ACQ76569.1 nonstructural protein NS-3 [Culex pipiens densovirus]